MRSGSPVKGGLLVVGDGKDGFNGDRSNEFWGVGVPPIGPGGGIFIGNGNNVLGFFFRRGSFKKLLVEMLFFVVADGKGSEDVREVMDSESLDAGTTDCNRGSAPSG